MRLEESIRRKVITSTVGGIFNRFKILSRRNVLFFDDIFMSYIEACEKAGHGEEIKDIGREWMNLYFSVLVPGEARKIPPATFFNIFMRKIWSNLGLLEDLKAKKEGRLIKVMTKGEKITETIGENMFLPGLYMGALDALCGSRVELAECKQTGSRDEWNIYSFRITNDPAALHGKPKLLYDRLNRISEIKGFSLEDAIKSKAFQLKSDNRIFFRGRQLSPVENTIFHLIGNRGLLMDRLAEISFGMFRSTIKDSDEEGLLALLKTLLQVMGWGRIKIAIEGKTVAVNIESPPFGLQLEEDNWSFLAYSALGYMRLISKGCELGSIRYSPQNMRLRIAYEMHQ